MYDCLQNTSRIRKALLRNFVYIFTHLLENPLPTWYINVVLFEKWNFSRVGSFVAVFTLLFHKNKSQNPENPEIEKL